MAYEWIDRFNEFMAEWMRKAKNLPCVAVISVESNAYEPGGCETCGSGLEYEVDITWVDENGNRKCNTFQGRLEDIIGYA